MRNVQRIAINWNNNRFRLLNVPNQLRLIDFAVDFATLTSLSVVFSCERSAARFATMSSISFKMAPSAATSDELLSNSKAFRGMRDFVEEKAANGYILVCSTHFRMTSARSADLWAGHDDFPKSIPSDECSIHRRVSCGKIIDGCSLVSRQRSTKRKNVLIDEICNFGRTSNVLCCSECPSIPWAVDHHSCPT